METATPSSPPFAPPLTPVRHRRLQARPSSLERSGVAAGSPSPLPRPPPFARKSKRFSKDIAPRGETRGQISGTSGTVSHRTRTVPPSSGASVRKICLRIFRCLSSLFLSLSLSRNFQQASARSLSVSLCAFAIRDIRRTDRRNLVKSDLILMIFYLFINITVIMINGRQAGNALSRAYQI